MNKIVELWHGKWNCYMFSSLAHFFSKCTFLRLRHFISTWTKSIDPIFHWTLHVWFKFLMKHFLLVATVGMIREKMWWKKWWLVCAFCANLLKKVTKKIRKGKNFLLLINYSKKFFISHNFMPKNISWSSQKPFDPLPTYLIYGS